ncbi:uncharacterized protein LOC112681287, partial [Sipha flava]|uniref:Uncharacterized protein LOC112681287 n=1 Tax=Sipha flava TaxID=143950 RepID=A0A8B8F9P0_9HEMI
DLKAVEDLMVYKKSLKGRMVGIRWSYSENSNLNGFLVSFDVNAFSNTTNTINISPEKCTAWPEYYCHTFHNLTFNKLYKFNIKPTSVDYPEGDNVSSITFSALDGIPDSPRNIKTTEIGHNTINLQWDIPWIFNGVLKMFIVNVEEISSADINTCCTSITPIEIPIDEELPNYNYTLVDLKPGSTYSIGVMTVSKSSHYSSPAKISATTLTI